MISGGTGFLGSHLVDRLLKSGHEIIVLKRTTSDTHRIDHVLGSVLTFDLDNRSINSVFDEVKPTVIIHTACDYGRKGSTSGQILETNLMFGVQLMEAAIANKTGLFINTGSLLPRDVNDYSLSKDQLSQWLQMYHGKITTIDLRIEHMYGPRDDSMKFVNWLIAKMLDGTNDPIELTSGIQKRDFIYIDDVTQAYELVLNLSSEMNGYNSFDVGTGDFVPIKDFILALSAVLEQTKNVEIVPRLQFGKIPYREKDIMEPDLDNTKLVALGWKPNIDLPTGIHKVVDHY